LRGFVAQAKPARPAASNKLQRLLGDDVYDTYVNKVATDLQPWYLRPNYSPSDIIIEPDGSVRGGSLPALIERLTAHEQAGESKQYLFIQTLSTSIRYHFQQSLPYDL
jgi:son of sevenless-like protein